MIQRLVPSAENLLDCLKAAAAAFPGKVAYRFLDSAGEVREQVTFATLDGLVKIRADVLRNRGMAGQPVILLQATSLDFIVSAFAVMAAGGAIIPLNSRAMRAPFEHLRRVVDDASPAAIMMDSSTLTRIRRGGGIEGLPPLYGGPDLDSFAGEPASPAEALVGVDPSRTAVIQYTSGSTSEPKGACITHANLIANARMLTQRFRASADDAVISWLPLFHDMGLMTGVIWSVVEGATSTLLQPSAFAARPASWLQALSTYGGAISAGPDFAYRFCADRVEEEDLAGLDLSAWRIAICGAEPVQPHTIERFCERFGSAGFSAPSLFPSYGLAEATLFVSGGPRRGPPRTLAVDAARLEREGVAVEPAGDIRRLTSCGRVAPGIDLAIVDAAALRRLPERAVGEIWLSGPNICQGYLGRDEINRTLFTSLDDKVYLRTGDLGLVEDGDLFVVGRIKDILIVRGAKYAPQDIELTCADAHPALNGGKGAVFALEGRDDDGGLVVVHEIRRGFESQADTVMAVLRAAVARAHGVNLHGVGLLPRHGLPLTSSGKVRRQPAAKAWTEGGLGLLARWTSGKAPAPISVSSE